MVKLWDSGEVHSLGRILYNKLRKSLWCIMFMYNVLLPHVSEIYAGIYSHYHWYSLLIYHRLGVLLLSQAELKQIFFSATSYSCKISQKLNINFISM